MASQGANMYRVGDFVYFEESSNAPYQIRRIDDLSKTATGVEARVTLFYRRRDVPPALLKIADQAQRRFDDFYEVEKKKLDKFSDSAGFTVANGSDVKKEENDESSVDAETEYKQKADWGNGGLPIGAENITPEVRLKLRQHELFLTRQSDMMPASQIRGKCKVSLLSEVEEYDQYIQEDAFFYSLVFDPTNMSLLADKGAIRVGNKYQAEVWTDEEQQAKLQEENENLKNENGEIVEKDRDVLVYKTDNGLEDRDIDQYLIVARALGTFARAIDPASSSKLTSLHMTVAYASRDITVAQAMAILHQANYDVGQAVKYLVPPANKALYPLAVDETSGNFTTSLGGPLLCRDQLEEWSAAEANLFEEALEKNGKDFLDIKADYLPWKSMRNIIEYYYLYKSSNRYADHKKKKLAELEAKLKQVYIPSYNKPCPNNIGAFNTTPNKIRGTQACDDCQAQESVNWYSWGGSKSSAHLCQNCWSSWKKNGGLSKKHPLELFDKTEPQPVSNGSNGSGPSSSMLSEAAKPTMNNPFSINRNQPLTPQQKAALASLTNTQQVIAQLPPNHPMVLAAKAAAAKGISITNLASLANFNMMNRTPSSNPLMPSQLMGMNSRKVALSRPPITYYSSIWRRVMRRIVPKNVLNIRKLSRKPFGDIDQNEILKHFLAADKTQMFAMAKIAAGSRNFTEADFKKGLGDLQAHMTAKVKRSAATPGVGEPAEKKFKFTPWHPRRRDTIWRGWDHDCFYYVAGPAMKAKRFGIFPRGCNFLRRLRRNPSFKLPDDDSRIQFLITAFRPAKKKFYLI